ncbi:MAG: DUF2163 domain-containing protein [Alphaproteobacteria bacterium]|nr:DUF2163 domain-containing protein [Alphaproteobacteria bacterium]
MKTLPPGLQDHLGSGATTLCWCWRLNRGDGTVLGFTDHDRALSFDGVAYEAATGFAAGEVQSALGLAVDNLNLSGALSSATLNEDDLAAGLYDNAGFQLWRVNWQDVSQRVLMKSGTLGEVTRQGSAFQAELRGLAQALNQKTGRAFSGLCDADLGDGRCGVTLTPISGTVASVFDARRFTVSGLEGAAAGDFTGGKLLFTGGANQGRAAEVKRHSAGGGVVTLELWQAMSTAVGTGDGFTITPGCDKSFATCRDRFGNGVNFRGFPHMPGNDSVVAAPAADQKRDGGSRYDN